MKKTVLETIDDALCDVTNQMRARDFLVSSLYDKMDALEKQVNDLTFIMGGMLLVMIVLLVMIWNIR